MHIQKTIKLDQEEEVNLRKRLATLISQSGHRPQYLEESIIEIIETNMQGAFIRGLKEGENNNGKV